MRSFISNKRCQVVVLVASVAATLSIATGCSSGSASNAGAGATGSKGSSEASASADSALRANLPAAIRSSGTLHAATNAPYPPYETFAAAGSQQLSGFDIDLGQAIGTVLGVHVNFEQQPFEGLVTGLASGKYDLVMAGMVDSKERESSITFVDYGTAGLAMLVPRGNRAGLTNIASLCGRKVSLQAGDTTVKILSADQDQCTSAGKPRIELLTFPQASDGQLALTSGKSDAFLTSSARAASILAQSGASGPIELVKDFNFGADENHLLGIAVAKTSGLAQALQGALEALHRDGIYQKLLDKYGLTSYGLDTFAIDGAKS